MQNVIIKGTKDGLTFHLNDNCSFEEIINELNMKLSETAHARQFITVKIQTGNRYITKEQEAELKAIVSKKKNLLIDGIFSDVITREEAEKIAAENKISTIARMIRSGQVIEVPGHLLLIGDVNPGGTVRAGGNIFILGALKGIAHAGYYGNEEAVIAASIMKPSQLRISDCRQFFPDHDPAEVKKEMECAYINENKQINFDRLQTLMHLRPYLTKLEGGL
ncbi:septum site-determining protein MinC [Bacillaceae bacterium Marseille-Q3522]|nr:septum site-determining protein MinC [Bacillaceae bacterium Marseille-Q3522]